MEAESAVDEVTVVEASLTVVLDIIHPPWDLEKRRQQKRQVTPDAEDGRTLRTAGQVQLVLDVREENAAMLGTTRTEINRK